MGKMILDDFIKYVKEQFDCDIFLKSCDNPDTFESIFGASFLNDEKSVEKVDGFENDLSYENISIDVQFIDDSGMDGIYNGYVGLAA